MNKYTPTLTAALAVAAARHAARFHSTAIAPFGELDPVVCAAARIELQNATAALASMGRLYCSMKMHTWGDTRRVRNAGVRLLRRNLFRNIQAY